MNICSEINCLNKKSNETSNLTYNNDRVLEYNDTVDFPVPAPVPSPVPSPITNTVDQTNDNELGHFSDESKSELYKMRIPSNKIVKRVVIFGEYWRKSDVIKNPSWLFVFGDNIRRQGCKGQAIIRHFNNSVGIATKIDRFSYDGCYFSDLNIKKNIKIIETDIEYMGFMFDYGKYDSLVFSSYGLGTGLARLEEKAPNTYLFLKLKLLEFIRDRELNITNILGQPANWEWLSI